MQTQQVVVVGAGVVGICVALSLRKRGLEVLLLDRTTPAAETSSGNAGVICDSAIHPLAHAALLAQAPRLLANRDPRFLLRYRDLPWLTPWLSRFARHCNDTDFAHGTAQIATLTRDAVPRHRELMRQADALDMLRDSGYLKLFRTSTGFSKAQELVPDFERYNVGCRVLTTTAIKDLEPDLGIDYAGALWMNATPTVSDPKRLCEKYFAMLQSAGAHFKQCHIEAIAPWQDRWRLSTADTAIRADQLVLTTGAWTNDLLKPLGIKLPFVLERGYHMMFASPEHKQLGRAIVDVELGFVMTPMRQGIRATTASNLVARDVAPQAQQLKRLMPHIKQTFPVGRALLDTPWMGRRASTPDSKPLIGPLSRHRGLFVATGHCHLGLTLAPVTGELIADELCNQPNPLCRPFYPDRFSSKIQSTHSIPDGHE